MKKKKKKEEQETGYMVIFPKAPFRPPLWSPAEEKELTDKLGGKEPSDEDRWAHRRSKMGKKRKR